MKTVTAVTYNQAVTYNYPIAYNGAGHYWDLGLQDLGSNTAVTLPDGVTTVTPAVSTVTINATTELVCFYANRFMGTDYSGIWVMRVKDNGSGKLYWSDPIPVFRSVAIDDFNYQSQLFITLPRMFSLNGEYWITALECSKEVNVITYHLCYFRSADGVHWSDREYLAGVSNDTSESTVGINKRDAATAFVLNDLREAFISVVGSKVFLVSRYGTSCSCSATSLVGVDNAAMKVDLTPDTTNWSLSLPSAPSAAQGNYTVQNSFNKYNGSAILVPGSRITHKAGYVTSGGNELITVSYELVDEIRQPTQIGQNTLEVITSDYTAWLRDWNSDMYWEYWSPTQAIYDQFCDLTGISTMNGRFFIGLDGATTKLVAATLDPNDLTVEDMAYINQHRASSGTVETSFEFSGTVSTSNSVAIVFQGVSERQFFSVAYSVSDTKWKIYSAVPTTNGKKLYTYTLIHTGNTHVLSADTTYYGKLTNWHNHIQFATSTDGKTWTTQINYTAPTDPLIGPSMNCNFGYYGILGHSNSINNNLLGNTDASNGAVAMYSGTSPRYFALKVTTGASKGTVTALAGLFTQTDNPPDMTIGLVADNAGSPADVTDFSNILFSTSSKPINFSSSDSPFWRAVPVPPYVRVAASTDYWIYWTFNDDLSGSQTWEWYTGGSGTMRTSTDGVTWSALTTPGAAIMYVDYDDGLVRFSSMYWSSAETPKTIDYLAKDIAAKASILNCTVDSFVATADLALQADGYLWQPTSYGVLGDFIVEADVDMGAETATNIFWRSDTIDSTTATAYYKLVISTALQNFALYSDTTLIAQIDSLQYLDTTFHLTLAEWRGFVYVYVNEALACLLHPTESVNPGYFGVQNNATWTNLRIPDMVAIRPYTVIESGKTAQSALAEITQTGRYKYFMRYDNTLRIGSFPRRTSVDTYNATLLDASNLQTMRYSANELMPSGNYYAKRWAALELDRMGKRRFKQEQYTDADTNEAAYLAATNVLLRAREQAAQYTMGSIAVFSAEREDRITVTNPLDGISDDYIITTLDWRYNLENAESTQKAGLRLYV